MLTVLVLAALIMVSVESDPSSTEEWKSLSNPKSRMLFFQILQSYLDGREGQAEGRKIHMVEDGDSNLANTALDKYSNFLYNSIFDAE
ncbi:uncharacterized protein C2orf66 homolog [Pangasianodon hypophthalmus]|uniref:uncharacterized protein C2orf66 homolog n=1 Tax=Pangasianodon hypophthalmus TaxID=310915 RepID=UPI0014801258|nr:uncharacterized protein C2orf66 homolog [Pangasianodon hypophthalmus]